MVNLHKDRLRKELLELRSKSEGHEYTAENENIIQKTIALLEVLYLKVSTKNETENYNLALYWPLAGEPDLLGLAVLSKWSVGLPKVSGISMKIVKYLQGA